MVSERVRGIPRAMADKQDDEELVIVFENGGTMTLLPGWSMDGVGITGLQEHVKPAGEHVNAAEVLHVRETFVPYSSFKYALGPSRPKKASL